MINKQHAHELPIEPKVTIKQPVGHLTYATKRGRATAEHAQTKHRHTKRIVKRTAIGMLICILAVGGWLGWKIYHNVSRATGDKNPLHLFTSVPLKNTNDRINVLLAGYSADDPGHDGATLTDSIMVLSVNQKDNTAVIISIPRDLWTDIPDCGYNKINAVFPCGESTKFSESGYATGGMGLLEKVVGADLGIDIHYYALINYSAFKDAVNAVGGITVDLTSEDNPYGLYDPYTNLKLPNGIVTLDGQTALNLARSRGDGPGAYGFPRSDFNRSDHQRKMLIALQSKASSSGVISNPFKISQLADAIGKNVKTDMKTNEAQSLALILKKVETSKIAAIGLNDVNGKNLLKSYTTSGGLSALAPAAGIDDYSDIQAAVQALFAPAPAPTNVAPIPTAP